jgi:hypothetical protein
MQKKKKRLIALLACVLAAALCLGLGALGMRYWRYLQSKEATHFRSQPTNQEDLAGLLYAQKHPYIGRIPSDLLQLLTNPKELYVFGHQQHTRQEPYGLQQWYGTDEAGYKAFLNEPEKQAIFQKNALLLMALIGNCDFVQYSIKWDDARIDYNNYDHSDFERMGQGGFTLTYDRAWADAAVGGDIKAAAETRESFQAFLDSIDQLDLPAVQPEWIE